MKEYPYLFAELEAVTALSGSLRATLAKYSRTAIPAEISLWVVQVSGYVHVMMHFVAQLQNHPEWQEELNELLKPAGCPAHKMPVIEEFLERKGVPPYEGTALDLS